MTERYRDGMPLEEALRLAVELLGRDPVSGEQRSLTAGQLEVAVLDRARPRRKFRRLTGADARPPARRAPTTAAGDGDGDEATSPPTALAGGSHEPAGPDGPPTPETPTRPDRGRQDSSLDPGRSRPRP